MNKFRFLFAKLIICLVTGNLFAITEVKKWEPYEIRFVAKNTYENPYVDSMPYNGEALLKVKITGASGACAGMSYTMEGFWDGNWDARNTFRIRFAPPATGVWNYESFSSDPGMNGKKGEITCTDWTDQEKIENPTRRGQIQVCREGARPGRYFEYADGTPFLWIADIWSYWTKKGINFSSFQDLVRDRVKKGFTVGMMRFSSNRRGVPLDESCDHIDNNEMRRIDGMIAYANQQGLTVWVLHWWGGKYIKDFSVEKMRRFNRYLIARLGAYNVVWVVAGEYNLDNYGGVGIDYWKDYGAYVKSLDPYQKRVMSIHHTPPEWSGGKEAPQWSTGEFLHNEKWMDFNQFQVGHAASRQERIPEISRFEYSLNPPKPFICTEPWIEFMKQETPADMIRFGGWSAVLSGAAGHTYGAGGVWIAHVPEAPSSVFSYDFDWYYKALDYPGGKGISIMTRFLKAIDWWKLEPSQKLIDENKDNFCSAIPGKEYIIFLRHGGSVKVNLSNGSEKDKFNIHWFNPRTGIDKSSGNTAGGGSRSFTAPDSFDWVLHMVKAGK